MLLQHKLSLVGQKDDIYGLTRQTLTSKDWYKENPRAAKHYFWFQTWKETVYIINALFRALPPSSEMYILEHTDGIIF